MSSPPRDRNESVKKVKTFFQQSFDHWLADKKGQFDADLMKRYEVVDASEEGRLVVEVDLDEKYSNGAGILHGGAVGLIFDMFTIAAFIALLDFDPSKTEYVIPGGHTWSMNVNCLRRLRLPASVRVAGEVVHKGKRMNLVRGKITSLAGDQTYYVCEHHKVGVDTFPQPRSRSEKL